MTKVDPVQQVVEALAKQLPVKEIYADGLSPAVREMGGLGQDLIKAIRLVLFPLQMGAVLQDRFRSFIEQSYARVDLKNRIPPAPQILGPVLEAIRYEPDETPLNEMFSELLSRACDSERAGEAHPSFANLLKQISSDEAIMLREIYVNEPHYFHFMRNSDEQPVISHDEFSNCGIIHNEMIEFYISHLDTLGIMVPRVQVPFNWYYGDQINGWTYRNRHELTYFGKFMLKACVSK